MGNSKTRVLLIEDNPGDARLIQNLLVKEGNSLFDLGYADSLSTGLKLLAEGDIDVLLLDLSLPDSQGLDSLSKVLAKAPKVPIVVMSGLEDELVAIKAVQEGAQDYLVKGSVDAKLLARSLRYAIERQHLGVALRESESRYRLLADNAADVIWTANMKWRISYVSPSIKRLLGYTVEEMKRLTISDILTPDSLKQAGKLIRNQMDAMAPRSQAPPLSLTLEHVRKDGSTLWAEVMLSFLWGKDGKLSEVLGVTREITERKKAEEALQESERRYRLLAENVKDIIWTRDLNLRTTYVSPSVTEMSGYSLEEAMSLSLEESMTPASLEIVRTALAKVTALEGKGQNNLSEAVVLELELVRKDGSIVLVEMKVNLLHDADGRPAGFLGVTRDITERKRLEEQLQLAGRLAAVGELAAGVAHELNNPLAAVQGFAQLLMASEDVDKTLRKDLETIYREAQRASKITGNLLSFGRRHEPEKRLISVNEVVEKTLELRADQMKVNNIEVSVELQPDLPITMADFHQMQQVFVNIINNAEQAMTEARGRGKLLVKTKKSGEMVQIAFTDTGPGIPEENLNRIFDPFFTTKEVGKGTGLGLSICYGIVEAHGGHIYARSKPGRRATFVVEIPIVSDNKPACWWRCKLMEIIIDERYGTFLEPHCHFVLLFSWSSIGLISRSPFLLIAEIPG